MKKSKTEMSHLNKMLGIAILATPHLKLMFADELIDAGEDERQDVLENFLLNAHLLSKFKSYVYSLNVGVEPEEELITGELFDLADAFDFVTTTVVEASIREQIQWLSAELRKLELS